MHTQFDFTSIYPAMKVIIMHERKINIKNNMLNYLIHCENSCIILLYEKLIQVLVFYFIESNHSIEFKYKNCLNDKYL